MTVRNPGYFLERKETVLGLVVNEYIRSVVPVSSGHLAKRYRLPMSSATIRNILAELEDDGLLMHPHTSSGRVPTQRGYRYFVDNLMSQIQLLEDEKTRIQAEYKEGIIELEGLLDKTSEVVSEVTNYTSIISVDGETKKIFCKGTSYVVEYPEAPDLERIQYILQALEEKEHLLEMLNRDLQHKIEVYIGSEMAVKELDSCSLAVSQYRRPDGLSGRIAVLGPTRMDYQRVVSALEYISEFISERI